MELLKLEKQMNPGKRKKSGEEGKGRELKKLKKLMKLENPEKLHVFI